MVIKDKKKFVRAIILMIGVIFFINILIPYRSFSHQQISYKTVSVLKGDTLWNIAKEEMETNEYYKNRDIRDVIYEIKKVNNLESANLKVNQTLQIPTY